MAAEQLLVELVLDDTKLQSALAELAASGAIDSKMADAFKKTTTEVNKEAAAIERLSAELADTKKAVDGMADSFRKTVAETNKEAKAVENLTAELTDTKKNLDQVGKATKNLTTTFSQGFTEGMIEALDEAGVSLEEFKEALEKAGIPFDTLESQTDNLAKTGMPSLRKELKAVTLELANMKLAGEDNSAEYQELVMRAGELKDTLADVNTEISDAGSDTQGFDNLLGSVQAVAGTFAAAQGAIGLFGDNSEELQQTLLKVNSAMAILQGLQSLQNALQKEGAITLLISNTQRKIQNAQLIVENGLQSKNVIVKGAATVAQYALNTAMAANPIGLVVVAIAGIIAALTAYSRMADQAAERTGRLNSYIKAAGESFERSAENIRNINEMAVADLEARGVAQSQILQQQDRIESQIAQNRLAELEQLKKAQEEYMKAGGDGDSEERKAALELIGKLEKEADDERISQNIRTIGIIKQLREEDLQNAVANAEARVAAAGEGTREQLEAQRAAIRARLALELNGARDSAEETNRLNIEAQRQREEVDTAFNRRRLDAQAASIEAQLVNVIAGTQEEYELRRRLLDVQGKAELQNVKLSAAERLNVEKKNREQIALLDRQFSEAQRKLAIDNQISANTAVIEQLKTNDEDRLALQLSNIELAAANEVDAARGNSDKIKEIYAQRDAQILATKKQFLEDAVEYEISLQNSNNGPLRRGLERTIANDLATFQSRKNALAQIAELDTESVDKRIDLINEEKKKGLISQKEYNQRYQALVDERSKIEEDAEVNTTALIKAENELRAQIIFDSINQTNALIGQLNQQRDQQDADRIQGQRDQLQALQDAGAITERDAISRAKRIDAEERKLKTQAAQREKALAIFSAVIATAQAVANSLKVGLPYGAILAGIAAGLGAAQVALIASKPIPRFNKGKKNAYEGPAWVGEQAPEFIQRNGQLYLAKKPTITYVGKNDKVYNPAETRRMIAAASGQKVDMRTMEYRAPVVDRIDYDKLAGALAKSLRDMPNTSINLDRDGFNVSVRDGLNSMNYWGNRYSS